MHLLINTYGGSLSRYKGRFQLKAGEEIRRISPEKVETITLTHACNVTTDAILLALEHEIPILLVDRQGRPKGRFWSHYFGSLSAIRRAQAHFSDTPAATQWVIESLRAKTERQMALLHLLSKRLPKMRSALQKGKAYLQTQLQKLGTFSEGSLEEIGNQLRAWEGNAARAYFKQLSDALPKRYRFQRRSRMPAEDLFNAALNYLYGMLYQMVEGALVTAGLDPYMGIFHRDTYRRPAFTYDFIEPWRPWADQFLMEVCLDKRLKRMHFRPKQEGIWLQDTGRALLAPAFRDFIEETAPESHRHRSRLGLLQDSATAFAQHLRVRITD